MGDKNGKTTLKEREYCVVCGGRCSPTIRSICQARNHLAEDETQAIQCLKREIEDLGKGMETYLVDGTPGAVMHARLL